MFSLKQKEVFKFPYQDYDILIADGSIRSGKSSAMSISFILWSMSQFNGTNFGICSKSIKIAERNIVKPLLNIKYLKDNFSLKYTSFTNCLTITRGNKTNYFYIFGGKDERSYTLIQGITLAGVLLDEVALMPESFVNQATSRCSVEGAKIFCNCNPEDPNHWFYKNWICQKETKHIKYLHFTMDDNPSLSERTKARYKQMYTGVFFERYIKGLWVRAEGLIYKVFADNKERYLIDSVKPDDIWLVSCGLDFGNNKSAHTFVATGITYAFEKVVFLKDKKITRSITPDELDFEFKLFVQDVYDTYQKPFIINCDSAETTLINGLKVEQMKDNLFYVDIQNALKSPINDRIKLLIRLLSEGRIEIVKDKCPNIIEALCTAVWDDKHPNERLDIVGHDNPVDMMDALEYSIEKYAEELMEREIY